MEGANVGSALSEAAHTFVCTCASECMHTNEADGPADEGVKVASGSINVGLCSCTAAPPRLAAEEDGLSHHDLTTEGTISREPDHSQEQQRLQPGLQADVYSPRWQVQRRPG